MKNKKVDKLKSLGRGSCKRNEVVTEQTDPKVQKMLKVMMKKQAKIYGQPSITVKGVLCKQLFSAIIVDRAAIKSRGILFSDKIDSDKVINKDIALDWNFEGWKYEEIELKGAAGQLVMPNIKFKYPAISNSDKNLINITTFFKNNTIINYGVARSLIDDEAYSIIKEFLKYFDIFYNPVTLAIGVTPRFCRAGGGSALSLEELLEAEVKQGYVNKKIGDKNRKYSYTHMLRRNMDLTLQTWQKTLIQNWKKYNFVAGSRRIGKSYLSAYIAYREFYRKGSGYGDRNRQVLYVTISDKKAWQPFQYMMQMTAEDRNLGYITVNTANKEFTCKLTGTKVIFITAAAKGGAASYGADLVVVDEAAMISNEFWDDLLPIIVQERATVFAISTINESAKQNWFYKYLLKGEMLDDKIQSMRVTIDDNELLVEEDKIDMKEALIGNQMKYWTQLYSIFPSGSTVFHLNGVIKTMDTRSKRQLVVIGYDPAKISDNASFVVVDPNTFETIEEHFMKGITYMEQKNYLIELKSKFGHSVVIMDRSGVGEGVFEIFGDLVDVSVRYKSSGDVKLANLGYWTVSKGELIDTLSLYLDEYNLKISDSLDNLIKEMKHFKVLRDRGRVVQYGGVGFTDDSVNALALITFYLRHISGVTNALDTNSTMNMIEIDRNGNIIDPRDNTNIFLQEYNYEKTYDNFIY